MAVPKKRTTRSKRNMRRSHHGAAKARLQPCPKCDSPARPHTACSVCGTYKGREVVDVTKKIERKEQRSKEKAAS